MTILSVIGIAFLPFLFSFILLYGLLHKAPVYDLFIEGAKDGFHTSLEILPFLLAIFISIESINASGALEWIEHFLSPLFLLMNIPEELLPLLLLRPVSGSGSLVILQEILDTTGPDSFSGRAASVMTGSCETVFYVLALYFGVTNVKKIRHAMVAGIIGYLTGAAASLWLCRIL